MLTTVICYMEDELESYSFSRRTYAEAFVEHLKAAGYSARIDSPQDGDAELRAVLYELGGNDYVGAKIALLDAESQYGDALARIDALRETVAAYEGTPAFGA